jgi:hypothetical protein
MDDIHMEVHNLNSKLDTTSGLQDRFDRWSGSLFGFKKRDATAEAHADILAKQNDDSLKLKEVFENQKYDSLTRTWKSAGLVHCTDPKREAPDLFDPTNDAAMVNSKWAVDFSLAGIDAEGWTYAYDFATLNKSGIGSAESKWNTYVRRRKWKLTEKTGNEKIEE